MRVCVHANGEGWVRASARVCACMSKRGVMREGRRCGLCEMSEGCVSYVC